ncbi:MAG TPA: hypothetical protein G4N95_09400 [Anaerolineae bacterium]|nr:hypothetical protein [Anaerolineae bacterium]
MLVIIKEKSEIIQNQQEFSNQLRRYLTKKIILKTGYQGNSFKIEAHTDGDLWWHTEEISGQTSSRRYWNAFGLLSSENPYFIITEINIPINKIDRRVGGAFAQDNVNNSVIVLHRGTIGGGRKGIGKNAFLKWYKRNAPGDLCKVDEELQEPTTMISVCSLSSENFLKDIYTFIKNVQNFKEWVVSSQ